MFMMTLCGCSTKTETVEVEKEVLVNVVEDYETNPTKCRSINLGNFSSDASAAPSDGETGCTTVVSDDLANYNFWDPQDGSSYCKTST